MASRRNMTIEEMVTALVHGPVTREEVEEQRRHWGVYPIRKEYLAIVPCMVRGINDFDVLNVIRADFVGPKENKYEESYALLMLAVVDRKLADVWPQ